MKCRNPECGNEDVGADDVACGRCGWKVEGNAAADGGAGAPGEPCGGTAEARGWASQCGELEVDCNVARIFMEGATVPFQMRVRLAEPVDSLWFLLKAQHLEPQRQELGEKIPLNCPYDFNLDLRLNAGSAGLHTFQLYAAYCKDGAAHCYTCRFAQGFKVFQPEQRAADVLHFYLQEGDKNYHAEPGAIIRDQSSSFESSGRKEQVEALLAQYRDRQDQARDALGGLELKPQWERVAWVACQVPEELREVFPARFCPLPARCDRLTLRRGEERLHVVGIGEGGIVRMGRNRACEVCARVCDGQGQVVERASKMIGGKHARFELGNGRVLLVDGDEKPSVNHVWLDGIQVGQPVELELDVRHVLLLGGATEDDAPLGYAATAWSVDAVRRQVGRKGGRYGELAALVLRKLKGGSEHYVFLRHACALDWLELGFRRGSGIEMAEGGLRYWDAGQQTRLAPGMPVPIQNEWRVDGYDPMFPPGEK
jgi:hypothetical protein